MESSEIFLAIWATIATVLAIYYRHKTEYYMIMIMIQQMGFKLIGEGKAKVIIDGDRVSVREV
jgi:hypothetical protein